MICSNRAFDLKSDMVDYVCGVVGGVVVGAYEEGRNVDEVGMRRQVTRRGGEG